MITITENNKDINIQVEKLNAMKQANILLYMFRILARGSGENGGKQVEQFLHNLFKTGVKVTNDSVDNNEILSLLTNAILGAIATLTDGEFDYLLTNLLNNAYVVNGDVRIPLNKAEIERRFENGFTVFILLKELFVLNFMKSSTDNQ